MIQQKKTIPFRETADDLPLLQSVGGRRRADVELAQLDVDEQAVRVEEDRDDARIAAEYLGRILAYGTESRTIATMGKRFWAICFVLRPDLLDGQTLESFGSQDNKTRQSIEYYVKEFRNTFGL